MEKGAFAWGHLREAEGVTSPGEGQDKPGADSLMAGLSQDTFETSPAHIVGLRWCTG